MKTKDLDEINRLVADMHQTLLAKILFLLRSHAVAFRRADLDLERQLLAIYNNIGTSWQQYVQGIDRLVGFMRAEINLEREFNLRHKLKHIPQLETLDRRFNNDASRVRNLFKKHPEY